MKLRPGMREKNGSIEYRFTVDGKRRSVSGRTVKECLEKEREIRLAGTNYTSSQTVDQYFTKWIEKRHIKETTYFRYKCNYKHIGPIIGTKSLSDVTRADIVRIQERNDAALSLTKLILNDAVKEELLVRSPAATVKPYRKEVKHHRALTVDEQKRFLKAAEKEWLYEAFYLCLLTGARIGEIMALTWADISDVIKISKTVTRGRNGAFIVGTSPKTSASRREIPVTQQISDVLDSQRKKSAVFGSDLVFVSCRGNMNTPNTARQAFNRIAADAGLKDVTTHCLRDTFATRWIERGGSIQILKSILGHTSIKMTMDLYAQVLPDAKKKEMEQIIVV